MVELCAGGQYGEYPETFCVNREQAANAVSLFFREQEQQVVADSGWLNQKLDGKALYAKSSEVRVAAATATAARIKAAFGSC